MTLAAAGAGRVRTGRAANPHVMVDGRRGPPAVLHEVAASARWRISTASQARGGDCWPSR